MDPGLEDAIVVENLSFSWSALVAGEKGLPEKPVERWLRSEKVVESEGEIDGKIQDTSRTPSLRSARSPISPLRPPLPFSPGSPTSLALKSSTLSLPTSPISPVLKSPIPSLRSPTPSLRSPSQSVYSLASTPIPPMPPFPPPPLPSPSPPFSSSPQGFRLHNISMRVRRGTVVAVVGPVGSGKSSLIQALLGEMTRADAYGLKPASEKKKVRFGGSIAYCSQVAWIQSTTIVRILSIRTL